MSICPVLCRVDAERFQHDSEVHEATPMAPSLSLRNFPLGQKETAPGAPRGKEPECDL